MGEIKERDYMFDSFRGLCMWCIPISHFTRMAGDFHHDTLSGVVYITINVFVMQAFMFLSGYFSKKPEKSREIAFKTFLWPYLLSIPFFYLIRLSLWGSATFYLVRPPFAMWFMLALFLYKFFQKNYLKIPHLFGLVVILYAVAGCVPWFSEEFSLGRIISYFLFFLIGYYCQEEHIKKLKALSNLQSILLGITLIGISVILAVYVKDIPVEWYLMRRPGAEIGVLWWQDIVGRILLAVLGAAWIIFFMNILPNKKNYLAYVGMNTMPVYIFHLVVRQWIKKHGITLGIFDMGDNVFVYYAMIFGLASLCVLVFSSKPFSKLYDFAVDGSYFILIWILNKIIYPVGEAVENLIYISALNLLERIDNRRLK